MRLLPCYLAILLSACANPDLGPTPAANRNVISAGVGVASVLTDCGDGYQRSTPGAGAGFILTSCLSQRDVVSPRAGAGRPAQPAQLPADPARGVGIVSLGLGLGATVTNCGDWTLSGLGLGLGLVVAPCPGDPPLRPRPKS